MSEIGRHRRDKPATPMLSERARSRLSRRFYVLTAASTVVPGLGLIPSRRRTGQVMVGAFVLALVGGVAYLLSKGVTTSVLEVGVSRRALAVLIPVLVVGALVWLFGIVATARDNMPAEVSGRPRVAMLLFASFAALLVIAPAAQAARYALIQRSVIGEVFSSIRPEGAAAPVDAEDPWEGTDRVNILLVGSDAGPDRTGVRPDSTMVASIDTTTGKTVLFGIPRNLQNIPLSPDSPLRAQYPDGYSCGDQCLFEYVWTLGEDNAALFPGDPSPGLTVTKDAVSQILGLDIDYTTIIDLKGFTELVDAMGGVQIDVKERVCIGCKVEGGVVVGTTGYIEPGVQRLDGYRALWYSRSRADSRDGDFSRMRRQRCMVGALINQVNPVSMLRRYPELAAVLKKNVAVDIPQDDLSAWGVLVERIQDGGSIKSLPLTNKVIDVTNPDYGVIHTKVRDAIDPPRRSATKKPTSSASPSATPSGSSTTEPTDELADITATC